MKRIIYLLLIAALISNMGCAQKIATDKVPTVVTSAFKAKFPNATKTSWEMENANEYEAGFKQNGDEVSANFDNTGKWLETETEIKISALPVAVQNALSKDFAGFKIEEASKPIKKTAIIVAKKIIQLSQGLFEVISRIDFIVILFFINS